LTYNLQASSGQEAWEDISLQAKEIPFGHRKEKKKRRPAAVEVGKLPKNRGINVMEGMKTSFRPETELAHTKKTRGSVTRHHEVRIGNIKQQPSSERDKKRKKGGAVGKAGDRSETEDFRRTRCGKHF